MPARRPKPGAEMNEAAITGHWFFRGAAAAAGQFFLRD